MQVSSHPWIYQLHCHHKAETGLFVFKKVQTQIFSFTAMCSNCTPGSEWTNNLSMSLIVLQSVVLGNRNVMLALHEDWETTYTCYGHLSAQHLPYCSAAGKKKGLGEKVHVAKLFQLSLHSSRSTSMERCQLGQTGAAVWWQQRCSL